jgi:hypothetical protein
LCETQKIATETFVSLTEAYGDATLLRTTVFKWHKLPERAEKMLKTSLILENQSRQQMIKTWKCGARCDGERSPTECQDDCRRNGVDKNAVHRAVTDHLHM